MKVGIVTMGSRGDLQPMAALAHALVAAGHEVAVTANLDVAVLVEAAGAEFVPMDLDIRQFLMSPAGQNALMAGTAAALLDSANDWMVAALASIVSGVNAVADGADVVIAGFPMDDFAAAVCAARGVPLMLGYLTPWLATREFPQVYARASEDLSEADKLATYEEFEEVYWRGRRGPVNELRATLGLPPVDRPIQQTAPEFGITVLNAYSTAVVPKPADWGPDSVITGYWPIEAPTRARLGESALPDGLQDWLDAGPAPIYLGFGSMPIMEPEPVVEMAVEAAQRAGVRILIGAGWTEMEGLADALPDDVRLVAEVNHELLLPQCLGIVHHGGAGTTAAGLTAGLPTYVFSLFFDQTFWGDRVVALGAGGQSGFGELDSDTLAEAMELLKRDDVRERAVELGRRLQQENGVANAIETITDPARAKIPR